MISSSGVLQTQPLPQTCPHLGCPHPSLRGTSCLLSRMPSSQATASSVPPRSAQQSNQHSHATTPPAAAKQELRRSSPHNMEDNTIMPLTPVPFVTCHHQASHPSMQLSAARQPKHARTTLWPPLLRHKRHRFHLLRHRPPPISHNGPRKCRRSGHRPQQGKGEEEE